jgi:hypothetical protein
VNSYLDEDFIKYFKKLPERIQTRSKQVYRQWKENPFAPNLQFKKIHPTKPVYSVRVSIHSILWFWIGSHEEYNKMISQV